MLGEIDKKKLLAEVQPEPADPLLEHNPMGTRG
jgi:hypothetical protein